jgi:hypothetical protein
MMTTEQETYWRGYEEGARSAAAFLQTFRGLRGAKGILVLLRNLDDGIYLEVAQEIANRQRLSPLGPQHWMKREGREGGDDEQG